MCRKIGQEILNIMTSRIRSVVFASDLPFGFALKGHTRTLC
jgi:hypothetical protein